MLCLVPQRHHLPSDGQQLIRLKHSDMLPCSLRVWTLPDLVLRDLMGGTSHGHRTLVVTALRRTPHAGIAVTWEPRPIRARTECGETQFGAHHYGAWGTGH
jgi:hypothetical protein